ncbi:hypothetical protein [Alkalibacterium sp. 20]|uniref:hypothetical protein n=1 Tax=Alkalibacterium sp. 20 TaxID=1798803 RepID=UPI000A94DACE|nr:hypothetical protein [Alkalibacterium sp. 20]
MKKLTKLLALTMTGGLLLAACGDAYNGDDNDSPDVEETEDLDEDMDYETDE